MTLGNLSLVVVVLVILVAAGYSSYLKSPSPDKILSQLPWVGVYDGMFSSIRTKFWGLGNVNALIESGYRNFSKAGRPFVLPQFQSPLVLVPGSQVKWIVDQSDDILGAKDMQKEILQTKRTFLDASILDDPVHEGIIRRDLTRQLGSLIPDIEDELEIGMEEYWGKDTENWKDVGIYDSMLKVVSRTSNRVFVGLPLCRNDEYLDNAGGFSKDVVISAAMIKLIPEILKPFLAWIFLLPNRWHHYKCAKHLVPFIRQRSLEVNAADGTEGSSTKHNDFTTWFIREAATNPDSTERTPEKVALRLVALNFAAIHSSTFTATNMLFDLFSSPTAAEDVEEIREEIRQVLAENDGKWNKSVVAKLVKTDSALRESLRMSTFMMHGMDRLVVDPKGVTMADGLYLPYGTRIATAAYSIHHDNSIYENADSYEAFRFSRARDVALGSHTPARAPNDEDAEPTAIGGGHGKETRTRVLQSKNLATVTTSEIYLPFGHGKHACPGRFFAVLQMKLLLAYIVMNYDIKALDSRPPNKNFGGAILPPMKSTLSIKRRSL